ncbi:MAG: hypothetical protein KDI30_07255, partial [Pseudomonadales bacterium]|nr:hypothetical protein [Pseudomonadales bacterium]
ALLKRLSNRFVETGLVFYALIAMGVVLSTFWFISINHTVGPFKDMWIAMEFIRSIFEGNGHFLDAFAFHGGAHRLAFPKLLFLVEYGVFKGTNIFLIAVSVVTQCTVLLLFTGMSLKGNFASRRQCFFLFCMAVIFLFNATQLENFIYTFDTQWFLTCGFAVLAIAFFVYYQQGVQRGRGSLASLLLAFTAATLSALSSFSGLCCWLVLLLMALIFRLPARQVFTVLLGCVLFLMAYLNGFFSQPEPEVNPANIPSDFVFNVWEHVIFRYFRWIGLYFGSPLSRENFIAGSIFAYSAIFFLATVLALVVVKRCRLNFFQQFCLGIALFGLGVGLATGLGRLIFVNIADEDRFQTVTLTFWLGVYGLAFSLASAAGKQKWPQYIVTLLILFWSVIVLPRAGYKDALAHTEWFDRVRHGNLALAVGQPEFHAIKWSLILGDKNKRINRPAMHADILKREGWAIFSDPLAGMFGMTISTGSVDADRCVGTIGYSKPLGPGYSGFVVYGRAWDSREAEAVREIILIDDNEMVVGLAKVLRPKGYVGALSLLEQEDARWQGYVNVPMAYSGKIQALGIVSGGQFCKLGKARVLSRPET